MNIKYELIKIFLSEVANNFIDTNRLMLSKIADTTAIKILEEIRQVIANETLSDFEVVEEIVCILEKNDIYCGGRHDF